MVELPIAVLADVHANLAALEAVAEDLRAHGASAVWHLGDAVGYGPEPFACLQLLADLGAVCVAGNHERALLDQGLLRGYNEGAAAALRWTASRLSPALLAELGELPLLAQPLSSVTLFHGIPGNPTAYLRTATEAEAVLAWLASTDPRVRLGLFGHTHHRAVYSRLGKGPVQAGPAEGEILLAPGRAYLVNPGSVGQPRDGDPRASYLLLDREAGRVRYREVPYDVARTQSLILQAGLPPHLAARLSQGI